MMNPAKGKKIFGAGGKCTRPGGYCGKYKEANR
jgi:hypothetical protein